MRKFLLFIFILISLSSFSPLLSAKTYALLPGEALPKACYSIKVTTEKGSDFLTPEDKFFTLTIKTREKMKVEDLYYLDVKDDLSPIGGNVPIARIPNPGGVNPLDSNTIVFENVFTPRGSPLGVAYFYLRDDTTTFQDTACEGPITIGDNPNCSVQPLRQSDAPPYNKLAFKVNGLVGGDDVKRGIVIRLDPKLGYSGELNTCKTEKELREGVVIGNSSGQVPPGLYRIYVKRSCNLLNTADGGDLCKLSSNQKIYSEYAIFPSGVVATGLSCSLKENISDENSPNILKNPSCFVPEEASDSKIIKDFKGKFPYCVPEKDANGDVDPTSDKGVCSSNPAIIEKCTSYKDGTTKCSTALGDINTTPSAFISWIFNLILGISGGLLLIFLIINGYKLMSSQGDPEKIKEARESITAAIVGLLFIIFSVFLLRLITVDILQIPGFGK